MKILNWLFIGGLAALAGCSTPYQKQNTSFFSMTDAGFVDTKIQEGVYRIAYIGEGHSSAGTISDYALLRAAEVALENNYKHFIIIESAQDSRTRSYTMPAQANTYGNVNALGAYTANTYVTGGQTYTIDQPSANMIIKCFVEKPAEQNGVIIYAAEEVRANLKAQYKIK